MGLLGPRGPCTLATGPPVRARALRGLGRAARSGGAGKAHIFHNLPSADVADVALPAQESERRAAMREAAAVEAKQFVRAMRLHGDNER